jgi:hypothetical protein
MQIPTFARCPRTAPSASAIDFAAGEPMPVNGAHELVARKQESTRAGGGRAQVGSEARPLRDAAAAQGRGASWRGKLTGAVRGAPAEVLERLAAAVEDGSVWDFVREHLRD